MTTSHHEQASKHHLVQFYTDDLALTAGVSQYLLEGLRKGEWAVVIATGEHCTLFQKALESEGFDASAALHDGRLVFRDARETLVRFMSDGQPDWQRFDDSVGSLIRDLRTQAQGAGLRAYGEMVDLLWNAGHSSAAIRLEQFWNKLLDVHALSLLCAYQIDVFGNEFQTGVLDNVLRAHTHLVPARSNGHLDEALNAALHETLGCRAEGLQSLIHANFRPSWASIPHAEATVLWLRNNLPEYADEILSRAKRHYQVNLDATCGGDNAN